MTEQISKGKEITVSTLKINVQPAVIVGNWEKAEAEIKKRIDDKKFLVTPETIQEGKADAAELRKEEKKLAEDWKAVNELVNGDFNKASSMVMKFRKMFTAGADEIAAQVTKIEAETKVKIEVMLSDYRHSCWLDLNVRDAFKTASTSDLILLGSMTAKGELTKGVKTEIKTRCELNKALQDKIDARVQSVELQSMKAGIEPLTIASVSSFLYDDDFDVKLAEQIAAEVKRNEAAAQKIRDQLQAEHEEKERIAVAAALKAQQEEANRKALINSRVNSDAGNSGPILNKSIAEINSFYEERKIEPPAPIVARDILKDATGNVVYTVKIICKQYDFTSRPNTEYAKIEAHFRKKAVIDGVPEDMILSVEVSGG